MSDQPQLKRAKTDSAEALTAGAKVIDSDESKIVKGLAVPLVIQCDKDLKYEESLAWIGENQPFLEQKLKLHGAILFRGFPLNCAQNFDDFVCSFKNWEDLSYEDSLSFAVRVQKSNRICTTNEGKNGGLVFHHEQAQSPRWPSKLFFCCELAATPGDGGETGVCRSDQVLDQLREKHPKFIQNCEEHGVKYTVYMADSNVVSSGVGRSWKSYFRCKTKEECESRMKDLGYTWVWQEDGTLCATTPRLEAVTVVPGTQTKCFFNQLPATVNNAIEFSNVGSKTSGLDGKASQEPSQEGIDKCISFGDGSQVSLAILQDAKEICEENAVNLKWQDGDVGLLDNYLVMHARRIWNGSLGSRKLLASLVR